MKAPVTKAVKRCCPSVCEPVCASMTHPSAPQDAARVARVFKALGDETRLSIVAMLGRAGCALCVCELEANFELSQPTISHHLKVLRDAGVVQTERRGTWVYYSLKREATAHVLRFCEGLHR